MPLNLSNVGHTTKPRAFTYDWKTLATYALGIGAKRDELGYLYEGAPGGMKVYPTFGVIPSQDAAFEVLEVAGAELSQIVHGGQTLRVHRPIPTSGTLVTTATLSAIYDLKKFAQVIVETKTTLDDAPLFDTVWSIIARGAGGFGGPRPPHAEAEAPVPKNREPDWVVEETTTPEQALLYRLSGDHNPLHADPEVAEKAGFAQGPILHGLCTYGFAARAIIQKAAGGDASRLRAYGAQFRKPVWPGDTLVTQGYALDNGKIAVVTSVKGRPDPVLTSAWAEIG
ncbi:3-alpha,7-alpha, 12-alpha-trihydroxy-5-beta-cholest-24-enoyl-CoA hydratase [Sorangium cellulosum]|uniref:3-alpha,7-alpha, 12-alpha-trihydroxy-5-beta-cholest-24-enoyl-CoA hydratase n=1 Tax=Sorangium cellulosum TaxID=56 RepID=A0A2L0EP26_SORCE|nr:MaoC/PaaZ C-terminal domain-containing protein [Sorangium cellulosum]AUX41049.1 3-alpha,7-alpha, 12-alpha-trihydroxy-5-beta-cholest-24-enoyl-CoA hydratase [Sorangium cellulosum]